MSRYIYFKSVDKDWISHIELLRKSVYVVFLFIFHLVDCQWGDWELGECSALCGGGFQTDRRFPSQKQLFGGSPCQGESTRINKCNTTPCPGT